MYSCHVLLFLNCFQLRFQQIFYDLAVSDRFELILMGVVFLNMIVIGVEFYEYVMPCHWRKVLTLRSYDMF